MFQNVHQQIEISFDEIDGSTKLEGLAAFEKVGIAAIAGVNTPCFSDIRFV